MPLSVLILRDTDFEVLDLLCDSAQSMTVAEVQSEMRRRGQTLSDPQTRGSLEAMADRGYVLRDTNGPRVTTAALF
jgi:repressor of nif and glnA expression